MFTEQQRIISKMSAEKKLELSLRLYHSAKELRRSVLRKHRPELSEEELEKILKEIFLYARS